VSRRPPPGVRIAQWLRALPDFRGRDRLFSLLIGNTLASGGTTNGTFGGGLCFEGDPLTDANVLEMILLRYAKPVLAPIFDAALGPGDVLADVGANAGLYTLWGARRVGPGGRVHAFEPYSRARETLSRNLRRNGFENVDVVPAAVSANDGVVTLVADSRDSGLTSRYARHPGVSLVVPAITLDAYFAARRMPRLLKIDVEGMEAEVLRGARRVLGSDRAPAVVFEANPALLARAGTSYLEVKSWLASMGGYEIWSLRTRGLERENAETPVPGSMNVLAVRPGLDADEKLVQKLRNVRFQRNQNG